MVSGRTVYLFTISGISSFSFSQKKLLFYSILERREAGDLISYLFEAFIIVVVPGRQLSSTLVLFSKEL